MIREREKERERERERNAQMRECSKKQNELTAENQVLNKNKSKGGGVVRVLAAETERER